MIKRKETPDDFTLVAFEADQVIDNHLTKEIDRLHTCGCGNCMREATNVSVNWMNEVDEKTWQYILSTMT